MASPDLPPVPHTVPVEDESGRITQIWSNWFQQLFTRVGGHIASSITDLEARLPVATADIKDAAVTTVKLGSGAVTGAKLASDASVDANRPVDTNNIKDSAITTAKIAASAVTAVKIQDGILAFAKMLGTDWTSSKLNSGYTKLPNGIVIQWGLTGSVGSGSNSTITYPIAFPSNVLCIVASPISNSAALTTDTGSWGTANYGATTFLLCNRTSASNAFSWIAIGS